MKYLKKIQISLLILSVLIMTIGQTAFAEDKECTYTIRIYPGNHDVGKFISEEKIRAGIRIPEGAVIEPISDESGYITEIVISNLRYQTKEEYQDPNKQSNHLNIDFRTIAEETDGRYYVRGIKETGKDNAEQPSSFRIESDRDYVITYGIAGDMVAYTVNYVDTAGNVLQEYDTFYGNVGDKPYVSSPYIDGYVPQAYNLTGTLVANEAENVFTFVYTPVTTPTTTTPAATTPAAPAADAGVAAAPAADAGAAAVAPAADEGAAAPGGEELTPVEDEDVPQDLVDLDEDNEEVPLANQEIDNQERPGTRMSYLPIYIGIGAAALAGLVLAALYLKKRRAVPVQNIQSEDVPDDIRNDE